MLHRVRLAALTQHRCRNRVGHDTERGMTLIEVVISVTVLGLVMGPLSAAMLFFMAHGQDANEQYADNSGARSAIAAFAADVQSTETVTAPDSKPCGAEDDSLATLEWNSGGVRYRASWSADGTDAELVLVRRLCSGSSVMSTLLISELSAVPAVTCSPSCATATSVTLVGTARNGAPFAITAARRSS